jgi:hypothetical protein
MAGAAHGCSGSSDGAAAAPSPLGPRATAKIAALIRSCRVGSFRGAVTTSNFAAAFIPRSSCFRSHSRTAHKPTLRVASKPFFEEDLSKPRDLANIGHDHPQTALGINRPKPFERGVDLDLAKPEFLANRPQASTADNRISDRFVTLFLPDDLCVAHA